MKYPIVYDYIIILCASAFNERKTFDEFTKNGSYLGGQVRMDAAATIYKQAASKPKLILVGGGVSKKGIDWTKPDDMFTFLKNSGVPATDIICVVSESNTLGNLRALWKKCKDILRSNTKDASPTVGLLTNFHHLPRAMRFASDPQFNGIFQCIPICAEAVVAQTAINPAQNASYMKAIFEEIKGLGQWEQGTYNDQSKPESDWMGAKK